MTKRTFIILGGIAAAVVILAAGWYFVSPLFINRTVDEALPLELPSETEKQASTTEESVMATSMPDESMDEAIQDEEVIPTLKSGQFIDADDFHRGSGTASIREISGGIRILRLEDFSVTNGPDLHVYLATGEAPTGQGDLGETIDLGGLKGNVGNQNYEIPAGVNLEPYRSVVIYCVPFHVVFSIASLSE